MKLPQARFACLGDYVNSRGAADMGLLPGFLPGYVPVTQPGAFAEEYGSALPARLPAWTWWRCSTPPNAAIWRRCMS